MASFALSAVYAEHVKVIMIAPIVIVNFVL